MKEKGGSMSKQTEKLGERVEKKAEKRRILKYTNPTI